MRVLYVSRSRSTHDELFMEAWREAGLEVRAVAVERSRDLPTVKDDKTAHAGLATRLSQAIEEFRPDVVHAGPLADITPIVCAVWSGPLIAMSWGFDLMDEIVNDAEARDRVRDVLARANQLIVDNDAPQQVALELGADRARVRQFPWGVDLGLFAPGTVPQGQELSPTHGDVVVLCTRRHEPYYDVETVVRAFIRAAQVAPRLRLVLAGNGSGTARLKAMLEEAGLESRVDFLGEVEHAALPDVYRAADLYVSASRVDGSSVSLLEAMACGIPVCVSDIEGNAQWVADGRGSTFSTGSDAELAAILQIFSGEAHLTNSPWRDRAERALDYVSQNADWSTIRNRFPAIANAAIEDFRKRA